MKRLNYKQKLLAQQGCLTDTSAAETNLSSLGRHATEVGITQGRLRFHLPLALNVLLDNRDPFLGRRGFDIIPTTYSS